MPVDSLGVAAGGELKDSASAIRFYSALRELINTTITPLILAHTSKDKVNNDKSVFGSVYFENLARNIWEIEKLPEEDGPVSTICLHHKATNETRHYGSLGFEFEYQDDRTIVRTHDPSGEPTFVERMSATVRIKKALEGGSASATDLQDALHLKDTTIRQALKRLSDKSEAEKREDGLWRLT